MLKSRPPKVILIETVASQHMEDITGSFVPAKLPEPETRRYPKIKANAQVKTIGRLLER